MNMTLVNAERSTPADAASSRPSSSHACQSQPADVVGIVYQP